MNKKPSSKSEEKYQRLYQFNQRILDTAPLSIIVINTRGTIVSVNNFFLNFTSSDNPVGRCVYDIGFFKREKLIGPYRKLLKSGTSFTRLDCQTVNRRGEMKFINIIAVPLKNPNGKIEGAISMATDNTETHLAHQNLMELNRELVKEVAERRTAEEQVRQLSEINQKILDNVPVSILMLKKSGEIVAANRTARQLMDKPESPLLGRKLTAMEEIHENDKLMARYRELLTAGKPFYYDDLCYIHKITKKRRHWNILAAPLFNSRGKVDGAISMATDNTSAIEAKEKLKKITNELKHKVSKRTQELNRINRRLTNILDLKSKFVADASHELRTPMTVIQGNIDLAIMEMKAKKKEVPDFYYLILEEIERMRSVLSDMTFLSNINTGQEQLRHEKVDLGKILKSVERSLIIIAREKNISLELKESSPEIFIIGDRLKLEKMISNLVRNAIKYTEPGGWVKFRAEKKTGEALTVVEDNGIGISKEDLPHIFERFYRADKNRARKEPGSGLGLSIVKWIAEAHGGAINVESEPGKGSTFTVRLPIKNKSGQSKA